MFSVRLVQRKYPVLFGTWVAFRAFTKEELAELEAAKKMPITFDADCPETTPERAVKFRRVNPPRNRMDLELSRRGGKVNIGKYGSTEVDFVTQKEGVLTYYQVTADMTAEETFEREMRPLRSIQDNYEKIVRTLDRFSLGNYDGIKVVNVIDWLLG